MVECIICREEKKNFSDEHVIPDALGGHYHIYSVCKSCNSKLGSYVDTKLINHLFSTFKRYSLGIKGKKGNIPNPFAGTHILKDDESQKVRLEMDESGKFVPYIITKSKESFSDDKKVVTITVDKRDGHKIPSMLEKIAKRNKINVEDMKIGGDFEKSVKEVSPEVLVKLSVDFDEFKIGLLKIAYEFAVDSIPEYYHDERAITISKYLLNGKVEDESLFLTSGFETEFFKSLKGLLKIGSNKHYLILCPLKGFGLVCMIYLSEYIAIAISLSKKEYLVQDFIFGINDIENKKFEKLRINELLERAYYPSRNRFIYYFHSHEEYIRFQFLQGSQKVSFYYLNGKQPLFDRKGNIVYNDINCKINSLVNTTSIKDIITTDKSFISEISLEDEELYLKFNNYPQLVRVLKVRNEQNFKEAI
jgi:hypothetical protein